MPRRKRSDMVTDNTAETATAENTEELKVDEAEPVVEEVNKVEEVTEEKEAEVTPVVEEKVADESRCLVIKLKCNYGISDLRIPVGYNETFSEDSIVTSRIEPYRIITIKIPLKCDNKKWYEYYKSLSNLGVVILEYKYE